MTASETSAKAPRSSLPETTSVPHALPINLTMAHNTELSINSTFQSLTMSGRQMKSSSCSKASKSINCLTKTWFWQLDRHS
jgi:hypothetical protein